MPDPCCWFVRSSEIGIYFVHASRIRRLNPSLISWPLETALDRFFFASGILLGYGGNEVFPIWHICLKQHSTVIQCCPGATLVPIANIMIFSSATLWVYWVRPRWFTRKKWWQCTQSADTVCRWETPTTWAARSVGGSSSHWPQLGMGSWICFEQQQRDSCYFRDVLTKPKEKQEKIVSRKLSAIAMRLPLVTLAILPAYALAQNSRHRFNLIAKKGGQWVNLFLFAGTNSEDRTTLAPSTGSLSTIQRMWSRWSRADRQTGTVNLCQSWSRVSSLLEESPSTDNLDQIFWHFFFFTGLQVLPQASAELQGNSNDGQNKPAFSFDNDTTMNLDGPGYALSLLLLGHYFLNSPLLGSIFGACRCVHKCCPSVGDAISRGLWLTWIGLKRLPPILSPCHQLFSELPSGPFTVCKHKYMSPIFLSGDSLINILSSTNSKRNIINTVIVILIMIILIMMVIRWDYNPGDGFLLWSWLQLRQISWPLPGEKQQNQE